MQLGIWAEEALFDRFSDVGLNYKTMVRRLTQQLKAKEELKSTLMTCGDVASVQNFIAEFANQKGGVPSATSAFASPSKHVATPIKEPKPKISGGVSSPQGTNEKQPSQDQSEEAKTSQPPAPQSSGMNPFGGPPKPAPPRQGNRGPANRMRGAPRFAAPRMSLPAPAQEATRPPPVREETKQTNANADSGSADDSTFVPVQPPTNQLGGSPVVAEENKEALDIIDNLVSSSSKPAVGIPEPAGFLDDILGEQSTQNAQTQELGNQALQVEQERPDQDTSALVPDSAATAHTVTTQEPASATDLTPPPVGLVRFDTSPVVEEYKQQPPAPVPPAEVIIREPSGEQTGIAVRINEVEEESKDRSADQQPEAAGETGSQQSS